MKQDLRSILQDLYKIDPGLRAHEKELKPLLRQLLAAKPEAKIDKRFINQLKKTLMQEQELEPKSSFHWSYVLGGGLVTLVAVLMVTTVYLSKAPGVPLLVDNGPTFSSPEFIALNGQAFGSLQGDGAAPTSASPTPSQRSSAIGLGGGAGGDAISKESALVPPFAAEPVELVYVYNGEELDLSDVPAQVFRRVKGDATVPQLLGALRQTNLGLIDLASFSDLRLDTFTVSENRRNGSQIMVDLNEEMISLYPNWRNADDLYRPVPLNQIPADSQLLAIANRFVEDHGISLAAYGEPQVNREFDRWRILGAEFGPQEISEVQVVYPLSLNGADTYEGYGGVYGFSVSINLSTRQVTSAYNLSSVRFEQSDYALETDASRILEIAGRGGQPVYYFDQQENLKTVEVEIDNAEIVYMRHWQYDGEKSEELYVPAIKFHVAEVPEEYPYVAQNIIVPVVKDILDNWGQQGGIPEPRPLPVEPLDAPVSVSQPVPGSNVPDTEVFEEPVR